MEDAGGKPAAAPAAAAAAAGGPGPGPGPEAGPEAADGSEEPPGPPGSPGDRPPTVRPVKEEEPRREEGGRSPDLDGDSDHKHGGGGGGGGGGEGRGDGDGDGGGGGGGGRGDGGGGGGGELSDKRRTSVEVSSSDGEPLSRMDSEDSISSTLMEMESTVSSGRSTPAMMNGQGSAGGGGGGGGGPAVAKTAYPCCWDLCLDCFNSSPDLAEHIRGLHVDGQRGGVFVCLWKGCKVYNTPSTSQSWLHRHMLTHSGDKPFKCVVGGCTASFASQGGLARHVPSHFSQQSAAKLASQARLKEESPSKAGLNKRKKLKNKRRRSLPRPHDFFDAQTMDAIRHRAICLNLATHIESVGNGHSVVFHSTVLARRKEGSGKVKVLLHWTPEDILPDVWVNETERSQLKTKVVHLSQLPADTAMLLDPNIYSGWLALRSAFTAPFNHRHLRPIHGKVAF
ncbi:unnamed protein product [Merluccius merluccius]